MHISSRTKGIIKNYMYIKSRNISNYTWLEESVNAYFRKYCLMVISPK